MAVTWNNSAPALANAVTNDVPDIAENFQYLKTLLNNHYKEWESDAVTVSEDAHYFVDPNATDQGATYATSGRSVYDLIAAVGTSTNAILYFPHGTGGATTTYTWTTNDTIPSNFHCIVEKGVIWAPDSGKTLTVQAPVTCADWNQVRGGDGTIAYTPYVMGLSPSYLIMHKGIKIGMEVEYSDATHIKVRAGMCHINDGTDDHYVYASDDIEKEISTAAASTYYGVFCSVPGSGYALSASNITVATIASATPAIDTDKKGWYHPTTTTRRCIGFYYINASNEVEYHIIDSGVWMFVNNEITDASDITPSNVWTAQSISVPVGGLTALCWVKADYEATDAILKVSRGGASSTGRSLGYVESAARMDCIHALLPVNASKECYFKWSAASASNKVSVSTQGFLLPRYM